MTEPPVQEHLAEVAWMLGRAQASRNGPAAKANLRRAHDEAKDGRRRAEIAERLGAVLMFTGAGEEAIRVLRAAAGGLPPDSDLRHRLEAYELYAVLYGTGRQSELRRLEKYRSLSDAPGMGERMLAVLAATHWMYVGGPSDGVADLTLRALAGGGLVAERASWAAFGLSTLTYSDRPEAEDWWDRLTAAGYTAGSLTNIVAIMVGRAESLWRRGELSDAEQWISDGLSTMKQWGFGEPALTLARGQFSAILLDRGDLNGARRAWQAGRDAGANDPASRRWLGREIELLLAEHSYELATRAADKYAQRFDHLFPNPMDVPWRSLKALALDQLGRRDEARDLAQAELELARGWGSPATVARTLRTVGCLEGGPAAVATLEEAVALVEHSPARLEHARSLAALGGALHGCGRDAAARETMHEALAISTTCGAQALAAETRADLLAAGGRPRRTAVRGVDALTPGELRVARLAARGRTNREIGEELFVTPKTAAMHLSNAYRKLGVASRRDLAIALSSAGAAGFRDPELASGQ
jgi:DNA-binding CsgD family transcriptional regulator